MKKTDHNFYLQLVASLVAISFISMANAKPAIDLPEQAKVRVSPHRMFEIQHGDLHALVQPFYTSVDEPLNHSISAGGVYDGVAKLILELSEGMFGCTGALLNTGMHVLTAAHCVTDISGNNTLISGTATFEGVQGNEVANIIAETVNPDWDGDVLRGNDIAILTLDRELPVDISRYDIDRNKNDDLAVVEKAGYGLYGTGDIGATGSFGVKRGGQNRYDSLADIMLKALGLKARRDFVPGSVLQYDFDNGTQKNDAFGFFFGKPGIGLGLNEVSSAPGDSGGPSLSMGKLTGITSYGISLNLNDGSTSDLTPGLDSSFGEFAADTRVSKYANWIDSVIAGGSNDGGDTTEPGCSQGKKRRGLC